MKRWRSKHPHENWWESHQGDWVRYEDAQAEIERLQVELDIERKLHQRASEDHAAVIDTPLVVADERLRHAFKNFHRMLCERFEYGHDEVDWERDQVSLMEWIAKRHTPETPAGPVPHGIVYDRPGWVCSICGFWNNIKDRHCAGIHLQSDGASEERLVGTVHEKCPHEDCHAAWRCTKCGEFRGECPPMRPHE